MTDDWSLQKIFDLIQSELERLNDCIVIHNEEIKRLNQQIAQLKVKAGVFGLVAGAVPVLITIAIALLLEFMQKE